MALIKSVRGFTPEIGENCFLADNAVVIGDVKMGRDCSIWFSTVLRGDVNSIRIGNGVNIQDGSVLHTLYEKSTIESRSGAGQGAEPEDCTQLSDVFRMVQIKGDKAPQKGRAIKGCHSITFTALSLLSLFTFLKVYHTHYLIRRTGVAGHIIACIHA